MRRSNMTEWLLTALIVAATLAMIAAVGIWATPDWRLW